LSEPLARVRREESVRVAREIVAKRGPFRVRVADRARAARDSPEDLLRERTAVRSTIEAERAARVVELIEVEIGGGDLGGIGLGGGGVEGEDAFVELGGVFPAAGGAEVVGSGEEIGGGKGV
jgi:hypothetical protein